MVACGLVLLTDWFPAMIVALMFVRFSFILLAVVHCRPLDNGSSQPQQPHQTL
jgi:hypothetical protein